MSVIIAKHTKYSTEKMIEMKYVHAHPHYEMYYLTQGDRHYYIEDNVYRVVSGDFALISPGKMHKTAGPHRECIHIYFEDDAISEDMRKIAEKCFNTRVVKIPLSDRNKIELLLSDMCNECQSKSETSGIMIKSILFTLLIYLYRFSSYEAHVTKNEDATYNKILDAVTYINKNYALELRVSDLCKDAFMSYSYFSKKFKQIIGMPAIEYINCIRINESEKLLQNTLLPITEISSLVGFSSSNYFGDTFKKYKGISPQKYRKTLTTRM